MDQILTEQDLKLGPSFGRTLFLGFGLLVSEYVGGK